MTPRREIYSIVFNKIPTKEGKWSLYIYDLGIQSANNGRIPKIITQTKTHIIVEFTDDTRHLIPFTDNVELFDRVVNPKTEKDEKN